MNNNNQHHLSWGKIVIIGGAVAGTILGAWQYVDGQFDQTRALIQQLHDEELKSNATSQDDLNYRLGMHQGEHVAKWRDLAEIWAERSARQKQDEQTE